MMWLGVDVVLPFASGDSVLWQDDQKLSKGRFLILLLYHLKTRTLASELTKYTRYREEF